MEALKVLESLGSRYGWKGSWTVSDEQYTFTREQLTQRLTQTVEKMIQYRDQQGHTEQTAIIHGVNATLNDLDAERQAVAQGGSAPVLQVLPNEEDDRGDGVPIF